MQRRDPGSGGRRLKITGDPTEAALVVSAEKFGVKIEDARRDHARLDAIPFESENQFMSTLLSIGLGSNMTVFIGIAALLLLQLGFIYLPFLNAIFGSLPLNAKDLLVATAVGMIILPVISVEKLLRNRLEARPA